MGDSSIYFAKLGNYVVAVEPIAECTKYIHLNAKLNKVEDKIKVINAAYPLTLPRLTCIEFRGTGSIVPSGLNNISYVKLSDIIDRMSENRVYLKVDCEGCEYDLVSELVPDYVNVVYGIAMEIHKEAGDHLWLLNKMSKHYRMRRIAEDDYIMIIQLFRKT